MVKEAKNNLVVKSNYLVEARYRLTLQEQRIILMMVAQIGPEDEDFKSYRVKIKDLAELAGIESHSEHEKIREVVKLLLGRTLVIREPESVLHVNWLSSVRYYDSKGYAELHFDPNLRPYLLRLKSFFTQFQLQNAMKLRSAYSMRIYELLTQYRSIGHRTLKVLELREMVGVHADDYKLYADFKRKVLKVAQKELAAKTDLSFTFDEIKEGRKVASIRFRIETAGKPIENQELFDRMTGYFCLSPRQARQVLESFPEAQILENLNYAEAQFKKGKVKNIGSYTLKAISEDYRQQVSMFTREKTQDEREKQRMIQDEEQRQREKEKLVDERLSSMADAEKRRLRERAMERLHPTLQKSEKSVQAMMKGILAQEME